VDVDTKPLLRNPGQQQRDTAIDLASLQLTANSANANRPGVSNHTGATGASLGKDTVVAKRRN
jgi:hypothetical protein